MSALAKTFAEEIAPGVITSCLNTGVFPSLVIAQAIQESGSGQSKQAKLFTNFFGHMASKEWKDMGKAGQTVKGGRFWRIYNSVEDCITGHINILKKPLYRLKGVFKARTPFEQALAIQKAGYNTGPDRNEYALKLSKIIKGLDLQKYDREMISLERRKNTNGLAYSEQPAVTLTLQNIFG
ncbi:glucosaminidase domain-containing protein [Mucilaginibacter sp. ZT4R22]|uniref:Glucosaminidase domain-containing protein n=1 Tax=Mucilaginibacter pankratovii TaxID=2772110 RepID=A0ABR7WPZ7_9SPHI|nr:glucosaminidase domain-containing protein [Mucilaginibacter pankratovii]MBD1364375.1 glucosaminidase domain-containing protein [Mucilaginibacter pankratovii]